MTVDSDDDRRDVERQASPASSTNWSHVWPRSATPSRVRPTRRRSSVVIAGQRVELGPESVLVGRSASMFGIDHPKVSRRHVGVQLVDGVVIASDLESRNGTWLVRGDERFPLTPMAVLWPGDRLVTLDDVELVRARIRERRDDLADPAPRPAGTAARRVRRRRRSRRRPQRSTASSSSSASTPSRSRSTAADPLRRHDRRPRVGARVDDHVRGARPGTGARRASAGTSSWSAGPTPAPRPVADRRRGHDRAFGARPTCPRRPAAVGAALPHRPRASTTSTVTVTDLGSTNGTLVEGVEIAEPTALPVGRTSRPAARCSPSSTSTRATSPCSASVDGAERVFPASTARPRRRCRRRSRRRVDRGRRRPSSSACGGGRCCRSSPASASPRSPAAGSSSL